VAEESEGPRRDYEIDLVETFFMDLPRSQVRGEGATSHEFHLLYVFISRGRWPEKVGVVAEECTDTVYGEGGGMAVGAGQAGFFVS